MTEGVVEAGINTFDGGSAGYGAKGAVNVPMVVDGVLVDRKVDVGQTVAASLQAPVLFTLADTGMGAALLSTLSPIESCATIEVKINYFRPVVEGPLSCRTEIVHRGRRTASLESTLLWDGKTVAKASGTFAIFARRGGEQDTAVEAE